MKAVRFTPDALRDLRKYRSAAPRVIAKLQRYAQTGAGDVKTLVSTDAKRLRDGDFRAVFVETDTEIIVTKETDMGSVQTILTPAGEKLAVLPVADYQSLLDEIEAAHAVNAAGA
eukprot:gene33811-39419_t